MTLAIIANLRYLITIHRCVSLFRLALGIHARAGRAVRHRQARSFDEGASCALRGSDL